MHTHTVKDPTVKVSILSLKIDRVTSYHSMSFQPHREFDWENILNVRVFLQCDSIKKTLQLSNLSWMLNLVKKKGFESAMRTGT